jgi:uncharacterized protein
MRTLARLNVTPVKGLALHHPAHARITEAGLPENRRFYLVEESGNLFSGSDFGPLVRIMPEYDPAEEHLRLAFPDGTIVEGDVCELGAAETSDFYGRTVPSHRVEGPWADAFSSYIGKPVRMLRCDADGDGVDVLPLTVVSTASVDDLASKGGYDGDLDSRRFRINLELDGCEPYDEDSWDGGTITIGEVALTLQGAIPRCVVTTQDPETGVKDWDTLTQIAKLRPRIPDGLPFGMYAVVARPGEVRVGDPVQAP